MDKQAMEAKEQMKTLSAREKWTNFWYYYKIHVIVGIFLIVVAAFTVSECMHRVNYDLEISYYSSTPIKDEGVEKFKEIIKKACEDVNENGSVDVGIASCFADPENASEQTQAVFMKLSAEIAAGESMVYLFDDKYKEIMDRGYSESAQEIFEIGSIPEVKEAFGLGDGQKLYWMTKMVYESEKNKPEKVLENKNAQSAANLLKSMLPK